MKSKIGKKIAVVGTIAAICCVSAVLIKTSQPEKGMNFMNEDPEVGLAYLNFLAKYQKTYISKDEY